jgi:hypothetical protein
MTSQAMFQGALMTRTQMALEKLAHAPFNHLTRLPAGKYFTEVTKVLHSPTDAPFINLRKL